MQKRSKNHCAFYSVEEALAYEMERPETWTRSPFLDEVLRKMVVHKPNNSTAMAELFGMKPEWFAGAMLCMIGISYGELHDLWAEREYLRLKVEHPDWDEEKIAPLLGYADRASLWNFLERVGQHAYVMRVNKKNGDYSCLRDFYLAKLKALEEGKKF